MAVDYDIAKTQLKNCLADYLVRRGIDISRPFNCLNPAHDDKHPSMSYSKDTNRVKCFSCGASYDIVDLIKIDNNITDTAAAFKLGYEMFGISTGTKNYTHNTDTKHNTDDTDNKHTNYASNPVKTDKDYRADIEKYKKAYSKTSYLKDRGISDKTANLFNIGFAEDFYFASYDKTIPPFNAPAVIIPTGENSFSARCIDNSKPLRYNKRGHSSIFNLKTCEGTKPVFVVEGEIDALSIIEAGYSAIGLGSANNVEKFKSFLSIDKPCNEFILCLDNDDAGKDAQDKIIEEMQRLNIKYYPTNISGTCKDPNEALLKDKEAFKVNLDMAVEELKNPEEAIKKRELEEYRKNYASVAIQNFINGASENVNMTHVSTGFPALDKCLDGGLYEGVHYIGAVSSLGKTTFGIQMADNIAKQGHDVLIFSLEMSRTTLISKCLSRITYQNASRVSDAKTSRGISCYDRYLKYSDTEIALINNAIKEYSDYADNIVIYEGFGCITVDKVREITEKHISLTGRKPVVILDYFQLLKPHNYRATDKQNVDYNVEELMMLSKQHKLSIIAISSFNRENYNAKVSMLAFKESGNIEYGGDVLIGLQFKGQGTKDFDVDTAKRKSNDVSTPRQIELVILKNRDAATGQVIEYKYYPAFNCFEEVGEVKF